ncbi:TfoX/Sxy family DNA transformation protein [Alienimonas sp. DA493]|uniref:TfoX/Sxy family DNA transformation protein n=1 Tax=Alienimonas sp. DA493 TaxID=3373605 RepID=UPI003755360B
MSDLTTMPHLDATAVRMLKEAGIDSAEALRDAGAADAYMAVKARALAPSEDLLWAIEGALTNAEPHDISADRRNNLLHQTGELLS